MPDIDPPTPPYPPAPRYPSGLPEPPALPDPPNPRDPRGLRRDAPLLDAWLTYTERAKAGELLPMGVPGHKQRRDLVGSVVAGDAPFYGGVGTHKHPGGPPAGGGGRAARAGGGRPGPVFA